MILILGAFDGFHLGHRRLLETAASMAGRHSPENAGGWGVVTFSPHPGNVIKGREIPVLFTEPERDILARFLHIPGTVKIPFTPKTALMSPPEFLVYLEELLPVTGIVVGKDFRFGRNREGDTAFLRKWSQTKGWLFEEAEPLSIDGEKVGSSSIRSHVAHGSVALARRLLGYPFFFEGTVVPGDGRGAKLGFPTANVHYPPEKVMPRRGVYCVSVFVDSRWMPGALNVGVNPTFRQEDRGIRAETHIIGYNGSLYGNKIAVFFEEFLRDEEKFDSPEQLVFRMKEDVRLSGRLFSEVAQGRAELYEQLGTALRG
ncbi:riboflavin kinase/FMN adenylyltransferase [Aminivibrio pyruvatiphilus]|uniref:Riboflavin biosynthesis protein n=1 Tax=Aminivibrio pyruvatiphilus TaxID=1005740 RepID=A0A4R8M5A0_9BACT|nr:riboflavin biosynthesis protein RibF [Aminivibrio pyruvatiphilus]TDY60493.1 riboflavin kinase/FMN adenylyltransferase [Aminivibrio pyruvatiphilus]